MLGDVPVIDAMVEATGLASPGGAALSTMKDGGAVIYSSESRFVDYNLDEKRYQQQRTVQEMNWSYFAESSTDIAVHHVLRRTSAQNDGEVDAWETAVRFRDMAGRERVRVMAGVTNPSEHERSLAEIDELIDEHDFDGLGFPLSIPNTGLGSPADLVDHEDIVCAVIDHARTRGVRAITIYNTCGPMLDETTLSGVERVVAAFRDVEFDIVHAGAAALLDHAFLSRHPNLYVNLAGTSTLLASDPRRFAIEIGSLFGGGEHHSGLAERMLWGTGVVAVHPEPLVELFWEFQMPKDLVEQHGYPEITEQMKRDILAGNFAGKCGIDLEEAIALIPDDPMRQAQLAGDLAKPWSKVTARSPALDDAKPAHDGEVHK